ncbi:hypothetical protein CSKR_102526 [Clonorchis sinensis]|uniref:Uncharacterized protein n=2 Tax=Clonorchis sinensis TaxID=79923 RepID=A0A8T1M476_CLOSI|nr:hypothetical protein CSKR_102526 [Clonorchis sinensis]GAA49373.1 hypothetical protein CLF_102938 [Clonorchis sinensis]
MHQRSDSFTVIIGIVHTLSVKRCAYNAWGRLILIKVSTTACLLLSDVTLYFVCLFSRRTRPISVTGQWRTWFSTLQMTGVSDQNRDACAHMSVRKNLSIQARYDRLTHRRIRMRTAFDKAGRVLVMDRTCPDVTMCDNHRLAWCDQQICTSYNSSAVKSTNAFDQVYDWYIHAQAENLPVSDQYLREKATEFARNAECVELSESNGWLFNVQKVHKVSSGALSEEANEDPTAAVTSIDHN